MARSRRMEKVNAQLRRLIASRLIEFRHHDSIVSVIAVDVTPDLKAAKIYLAGEGVEAEVDELNHLAGALMAELKPELNWKTIPRIEFVVDNTVAEITQTEELLDQLKGHSD